MSPQDVHQQHNALGSYRMNDTFYPFQGGVTQTHAAPWLERADAGDVSVIALCFELPDGLHHIGWDHRQLSAECHQAMDATA